MLAEERWFGRLPARPRFLNGLEAKILPGGAGQLSIVARSSAPGGSSESLPEPGADVCQSVWTRAWAFIAFL